MTPCPDVDEGWYSGLPTDHSIEVMVTDNPVTATLYAPDGSVLIQIRERPPFGFRVRWRP